MSKSLLNIIQSAIADVETRLEKGPPAFKCAEHPSERLPVFFDGMPNFSTSLFPDWLQQYIVAFSNMPIVAFNPQPSMSPSGEFTLTYEDRPYFNGGRLEMFDRYGALFTYTHYGLSGDQINSLLSDSQNDTLYNISHDLYQAYSLLLNAQRLNQLKVPKTFSSLQLYTFFKAPWRIERGAIKMMERVRRDISQLDDKQYTRDDLTNILCAAAGLNSSSPAVSGLIDHWGLPKRIGIYDNENDQKLAAVFFEILKSSGHLDDYHFNFAVDKACYDRGIPGIKTPGSVPRVMHRVFGSYYYELVEKLRDKQIGQEKHTPTLGMLKPISPNKIRVADTKGTDVRQIIEAETLGTGERDASSLNHSAIYRHPKVPSASAKLKTNERDPS